MKTVLLSLIGILLSVILLTVNVEVGIYCLAIMLTISIIIVFSRTNHIKEFY